MFNQHCVFAYGVVNTKKRNVSNVNNTFDLCKSIEFKVV